MQARHPPLVLVLDVAVRAVAHDHDRQVVAAGHQARGDVVLARQAAVGSVAGELPVDVDGMHAVGGADVQHDLPIPPLTRHRERPPVHTGRVAVGQPRRRPVERHLDVGVVRVVADALHGPVAGHRQRRPAAIVVDGATDPRCRHPVGMLGEAELPPTVERPPPRRRAAIGGTSGRGCRGTRSSAVASGGDRCSRPQGRSRVSVHRSRATRMAVCLIATTCVLMKFRRSQGAETSRDRNFYAPSWTQTGVLFGIRLTSQTQSIAGTLTRTQPCDAG